MHGARLSGCSRRLARPFAETGGRIRDEVRVARRLGIPAGYASGTERLPQAAALRPDAAAVDVDEIGVARLQPLRDAAGSLPSAPAAGRVFTHVAEQIVREVGVADLPEPLGDIATPLALASTGRSVAAPVRLDEIDVATLLTLGSDAGALALGSAVRVGRHRREQRYEQQGQHAERANGHVGATRGMRYGWLCGRVSIHLPSWRQRTSTGCWRTSRPTCRSGRGCCDCPCRACRCG